MYYLYNTSRLIVPELSTVQHFSRSSVARGGSCCPPRLIRCLLRCPFRACRLATRVTGAKDIPEKGARADIHAARKTRPTQGEPLPRAADGRMQSGAVHFAHRFVRAGITQGEMAHLSRGEVDGAAGVMRSGQSTPRGVVRPTAVMATSPHQKGGRGFKHMPLALPQYGLESPGGRFGAGVLDSPVLLPTFTAEPSPTTGTYPLGGSAFRGTTQGIQHLPTPKASEKKASALGRVSSARQAAANYASARSGAASYAAAHHPPHNPQTAARRRLQVLDDAQPSESSSDDDDEVRVVQGACPTRSQPDSHLLSRLACWRWEPAFWHSTAPPRRHGSCANVAPYPPGLAPCPPTRPDARQEIT
jgi:hypothetical protein